jgi:CRP/FNR family cyclic AMP-dependent transcriptional regulator
MTARDAAASTSDRWCLSEVDIFRDLSSTEMEAMAERAPMRSVERGQVFYSPHEPVEVLFILKRGRVRIFRTAADGRTLTIAILEAGTVFGEMVLLGQRMDDTFAEALEPCVLCLMSRADVRGMLLSDPRIAARITEMLGQRLASVEQRLSDTLFKTVAQRLAGTLSRLAADGGGRRIGLGRRAPEVRLTHEQLAGLVGASRETTTKTLNEFQDRGLVELRRGRVAVLDLVALRTYATTSALENR